MSKNLTRVLVTLLIFSVFSLSLLALGTIQDAEARRVHDCGYWGKFWNGNTWLDKWFDDWRYHNHHGPHAYSC